MFQVPLRFLKVGPSVAICATKISNMVQASTRSAQRYKRQQKANGKFIDGCAGRAAKTIILMDNGDVISSPYSINVLMNAIQRSNARSFEKESYRNPASRKLRQQPINEDEELDFPSVAVADAQDDDYDDGFVPIQDWNEVDEVEDEDEI